MRSTPPHILRLPAALANAALACLLAACGGGDPLPAEAGSAAPATAADAGIDPATADAGDDDGRRMAQALSDAQRAAAASATAKSTVNACNAIRPFYWEVGNRDARAVSGSEVAAGNATSYRSTMPMSIASASKWIYGSYVAQKRGGVLSETDRKFLSMRSGYTSFKTCTTTQTVDSCLADQGNGAYTPEFDGRFYYDSGHMQVHASQMGLGAMNNKTLAAAVREQLGSDVVLSYSQPQLAGGAVMSPDAYAVLLRKMLKGQLHIASQLGSGAACTNATTCGLSQALYAPVPPSESWHYAVGHWVEDDPVVGDGAFSSPGAFGFYPWIDKTKTYYGLVARMAQFGSFPSVQCGRLIRKAWVTGAAQ